LATAWCVTWAVAAKAFAGAPTLTINFSAVTGSASTIHGVVVKVSTVCTVGKVGGVALSFGNTYRNSPDIPDNNRVVINTKGSFVRAVAVLFALAVFVPHVVWTTVRVSRAEKQIGIRITKPRSAFCVTIAVLPVGKKGTAGLHAALEEAAVVLAPSGTVVVKGQLVHVPIVTGGGELHVPLDAGVRATVERS
jgi:hypothetical protein